jgi:hypothetical protein
VLFYVNFAQRIYGAVILEMVIRRIPTIPAHDDLGLLISVRLIAMLISAQVIKTLISAH